MHLLTARRIELNSRYAGIIFGHAVYGMCKPCNDWVTSTACWDFSCIITRSAPDCTVLWGLLCWYPYRYPCRAFISTAIPKAAYHGVFSHLP